MMTSEDKIVQYAIELDQLDRLAAFKNRFYLPQKNAVNLNNFAWHNLGLKPIASEYLAARYLNEIYKSNEDHEKAIGDLWHINAKYIKQNCSNLLQINENQFFIGNSIAVNLQLIIDHIKHKLNIDQISIGYIPEAFPFELKEINDCTFILLDKDNLLYSLKENYIQIALLTYDVSFQLSNALAFCKNASIFTIVNYSSSIHKLSVPDADFVLWKNSKFFCSGPCAFSSVYVSQGNLSFYKPSELPVFISEKAYLDYENTMDANRLGWHTPSNWIQKLANIQASSDIFAKAGKNAILEKATLMQNFVYQCVNYYDIPISFDITDKENCSLSVKIDHTDKLLANKLRDCNSIYQSLNGDLSIDIHPLYHSFMDVYQLIAWMK